MTHDAEDRRSIPAELRTYLAELVRRTRSVCGPHLVSVLAVGSVALGDYRHGRSDVDVVVVVEPDLPAPTLRELAGELAHPRLPCPAAGLELVVYGADFAARPSGAPGYLLNLNTGPLLPDRADHDTSGAPAFWFVIDRSIAHRAGITLWGEAACQVIAEPDPADVSAALRACVREHADGEGHLADNRVLNGCRALVYRRTGRWKAKREAARTTAAAEPGFRPLIESALRSFEQPRPATATLPAADVRAFLSWVRERLEATATPAPTPAPTPVIAPTGDSP
ncbi:aminoglycoside adenylyltransferase domain-containing protein [Kitasatospora sp. NPDC002965]|uniref:aminoglycoside adenylyltransferase domain-containing protein n=1 Tax=Kitasatospora sp. NPDC002965 TaxID=3154775 RepID=UPI0033B1C846